MGNRDFEGYRFRVKGGQKEIPNLDMVINKEISKVVIAYPDRLTMFGFKWISSSEVMGQIVVEQRKKVRKKNLLKTRSQ